MRTLLICHHDAPLHSDGIARWMASWSALAGTLVVREPRRLLWRRVRREVRRVGVHGLLDVMAFRGYYRATQASADGRWRDEQLERLRRRYPELPHGTPSLTVESPNSAESQRFIGRHQPDLVIALCKNILAERIFSIPPIGTFVLHPGICPEYRNAHGCFWALAERDLLNVGLTLLRIDRGIDTGPIFGQFRISFDEVQESHRVIQDRALLDNLDELQRRLLEIGAGHATPVTTTGRSSAEWGQPRLTRYLRWKYEARRRIAASPTSGR